MAVLEKKIRVLALCDYACSTGFATVSSNIMRELQKTDNYDVDIVAINATGDPYDMDRFPFKVYPAVTVATALGGQGVDVYGRDKFIRKIAGGTYDLIFIIQDTFIVQTFIGKMLEEIEKLEHKPKIVYYYPIDATPDPAWINDVVAKVDYPVPYTGYAAEQTLGFNPDIKNLRKPIYHGTNPDEFFYVEDREEVAKFKYEWFDRGWADGKYVIMNLNRNQPRKDILRSLIVLRQLKELGVDDVVLYLHMAYQDAGGDIIKQAEQLGLVIGVDYALPHPRVFGANQGVDVPTLNMIYNAVDCVITTTHGEGWGLSVTEAMATKTPVIAPNNTSLTEMLADNRGILVPSGDKPESWVVRENDNDRLRPIVNVDAFCKAIIELRAGKSKVNIDKAYKWVHKYSWENICKEWGDLFTEASNAALAETKERLLKAENKKQFKKGVKKKQRRKAKR